MEILQRTLEEQGSAFGGGVKAGEEVRRRVDRRIREEQDNAYLASLQKDQAMVICFSCYKLIILSFHSKVKSVTNQEISGEVKLDVVL